MYLLTAQQMRLLDDLSIRCDHIPSIKLMENAGQEVFKIIQTEFKVLRKKKVFIFCGPGNNGGDGFVVARLLQQWGCKVFVFILSSADKLQGDSLIEFNKFKNVSSNYYFIDKFSQIKNYFIENDRPHVMIDALFGTGLSRNLSGLFGQTIDFLNQQNSVRLSVDIPSGLCANTGKVLGTCFKADATITLGRPKCGFFMGKASDYLGVLHIVDIGLSKRALNECRTSLQLITKTAVVSQLNTRASSSHKGTFGHVYTVACSVGKIGAGVMAAYTALKAGAGLSTLILPGSVYQKIDLSKPELMYEPINDNNKGFFSQKCLKKVLWMVKNATVVALGPGIGTHSETIRFVFDLIRKYQGPLIIDADGLNAVAKRPSVLKKRKGLTLLTPHPAEMGRLIKKSTQYVQKNRLSVATLFAKKYGVVVLLKGYRSLVAFPNGEVWINPTGNAAMASAGQGDVLTGIYAGLLAQNFDVKSALLFGCFLHGLVGDLLAKKGQRVVMATDVANNLLLGYSFLKKNQKVLVTEFY